MYYGSYDPGTGYFSKILRCASLAEAQVAADADQLVIESEMPIDDVTHMVDLTADPLTIIERPQPLDPAVLQQQIVQSVQQRLDEFARSRGYDGILSACTYVGSGVPQFQSEGNRAVELRDQTWAKLYQMLAEVQSGARSVPSGFSDVEGELPALTW